MNYFLHQDDIPSNIKFGNIVAIDTETMGLNLQRDRLCLIQLSNGDGNAHLVQISRENLDNKKSFINLKKILNNPNSTKLFHFARFDVAVFKQNFKINIKNIYCTKIASKLVRTYTDKHGYKDLCGELLGKSISKLNSLLIGVEY